MNVVYGVHELDAYDPIIPASYYSAWFVNTGTPAFSAFFNEFCPLIATTSEAVCTASAMYWRRRDRLVLAVRCL